MYTRLSFDFSDKGKIFLAQRMDGDPGGNGKHVLRAGRECHGRLCALLHFDARYDAEILQNAKK